MLVPDKPEKVPNGSEPKEWATKALAGKEVGRIRSRWHLNIDAKNFLLNVGAKFELLFEVSAATLESQFELGDILDYIKTGIASVIEDEVTQRFVAEELKVSNANSGSICDHIDDHT